MKTIAVMKSLTFCICLFLVINNSYSQINSSLTLIDRDSVGYDNFDSRLLLHYSQNELKEMSEINLDKFLKISYYFLNSYSLENVQVDESIQFDINQFDITKYERFRSENGIVEKIDFKKGIKISLIPINELEYKLPIHEPIIPLENED